MSPLPLCSVVMAPPIREGLPTYLRTHRVAALTEVARQLQDEGVAVEDIALRRPTLDEVFLRLTGHRAEDGADVQKETAA